MSNFNAWLERKIAEDFGGPADYQFNSDDDVAEDYEAATSDLVKTVMSKYPQELTRFLSQLADERGDSELESLLKRVQGRSADSWKPRMSPEPDEVVAPKADRGHDKQGAS